MGSLAWYEIGNHLSSRIIRAAGVVHNLLGPGCAEEDYRRAITNELRRQNLEVQHNFPIDAWQAGELAVLHFLDLFVEWQVIVEIKATHKPFTEDERAWMVEYLGSAGAPLGMLLNFGRRGLEYERILP